MINGLTRRGVPLLLVVLPDGSRSLIPVSLDGRVWELRHRRAGGG